MLQLSDIFLKRGAACRCDSGHPLATACTQHEKKVRADLLCNKLSVLYKHAISHRDPHNTLLA